VLQSSERVSWLLARPSADAPSGDPVRGRPPLRFSLRTKLFTLTTGVVAAVMATVTWMFTIQGMAGRQAAVEAEVQRLTQNIATMQLVEGQDWNVYQDYVTRLMDFNHDLVYIAVYDERRTLRAHGLNDDLIDDAVPIPVSRIARAEIVERLDSGQIADESIADLRTQRVNIQVGERVLGSVAVGVSLIDLNHDMRAGVASNVRLALLFVALSGLVSFLLSRRLTGPIERLNAAMAAIAGGDLEQSVEPETHDEIADLARTFNDMVVDLRERQIIDRLGRELGSTFQIERLAELVLERLSSAVGARCSRLFVRREASNVSFREILLGGGERDPIVLDDGCRSFVLENPEGFVLADAPGAVCTALSAAGFGDDELIVPMLVKSKLFGFLGFCPQAAPIDGRRRHLAATLAGQAALALENALLYDELREQERMRGELAVARAVQQRLLPRETPKMPGFAFDAICTPAHEVGGDYFDFVPIGAGRLGVVVADVSGKGTSASLYMAEIKGMMLSLSAHGAAPRDVLVELNERLYPSLERNVFASVLYGVLDTERNELRYVRAGHCPLLHLRSDGATESPTPGGMAVGLDPGPLFAKTLIEARIELKAGDSFVLFSDGVTEAMNGTGEPFGDERLIEVIGRSAGEDPESMRRRVVAAVESHAAGEPQADDLTLVVGRRDL